MAIRTAVKALIVRDGRLLVTANAREGSLFYLCPGGGQEHGEDAYEALRRECAEEIGCEVVVGELAFVRDYIGSHHEFAQHDGGHHQQELYFFCTLADGAEPALGGGADPFQTGVSWLALDGLADEPLWPRALASWLSAPEIERSRYLGDVN